MADAATDETETKFDPDGWTVQDGPMPYVEPDPALAPQQFLSEQLPDPEGAQNAGVPEIEIPEGQITEAEDLPTGPEPDELLAMGKIEELPERETVETTTLLQDVPEGWTVNSPEPEMPEAAETAEDDDGGEVNLDSMTKAEIQEWAEANGYEGVVDKDSMSKAEMIEAIVG